MDAMIEAGVEATPTNPAAPVPAAEGTAPATPVDGPEPLAAEPLAATIGIDDFVKVDCASFAWRRRNRSRSRRSCSN